MSKEQELAVLFVDVCGSTSMYERKGDRVAFEVIRGALDVLGKAVDDHGGRVVKTIGDEVMAVFSTASAAVDAAVSMRSVDPRRPAVRIGVHFGPVIENDGDVYGDTVNVAARVVALAKPREVLMTRSVAEHLPDERRRWTRRLPSMPVKGKADLIGIVQMMFADDEMTVVSSESQTDLTASAKLKVAFCGELRTVDARAPVLVIGREPGCELIVARSRVSRKHATIELLHGAFHVKDESTNGTWVVSDGGLRHPLKRSSVLLPRQGRLWLGVRPEEGEDADAVDFRRET